MRLRVKITLVVMLFGLSVKSKSQCYPENLGQGLYLYSPVKTKLTLYKPLLGKEWGDTTERHCGGFGRMQYRKVVPGYVLNPGTPIYASNSGIIRLFTTGGNDEPNDAAWIDGGNFTTSYFNVYFSVASNQYIYAGQRIGTVIPRKDTTYFYFGIRYSAPEQPTMKRVGLPIAGDSKNKCACYIDPVWPENFVNPTSWNIYWEYNDSEPTTSMYLNLSPGGLGAWSFDNGKTWLKSGEKISGLPQKYYKLIFKEIPGYVSPMPIEVNANDSRLEFIHQVSYEKPNLVIKKKKPDSIKADNNLIDSITFLSAMDAAKKKGFDSSYRTLREFIYTTFNDSLASKISAIEKEQEIVRTRSLLLLIIMPLALIAGLLLISLNAKNRKLAREKKQVIDLQKELHHRVRNNLGVILGLLDASTSPDGEVLVAKDLESRIKSISLIHEQLFVGENSEKVNLQDFLEKLCKHLVSTYSLDKKISYQVDAPLLMHSNLATQFALIIAELFTNAIKHGIKNNERLAIKVMAKKSADGNLTIIVADNGPGFPTNFQQTTGKTYGMRMVSGLTKQLKGKIHFDNESGAKITLNL